MIRAASVHLAPASSYPRFAPWRTREIVPLLTAMPTSARGEEIASRVLDRLETEVVVLDAKGTIVFCNEAARRLLAANAGVFTHRGALHFTDFENNRWLQSQFVTAPQASDCKRMTFIFNADQRKHRIVSLNILCGEPTAPSSFVLTFSPATSSLAEDGVRRLLNRFGLTPAEKRLALFLRGGGRLTDAAKAFGVSCHTVRNQLRSVFEKAGVRRQAELTRLMWAGA